MYLNIISSVFIFIEICAVSKVSKKEIGRCFKLTLRALETSVDLITSGDFMVIFESFVSVWKRPGLEIEKKYSLAINFVFS